MLQLIKSDFYKLLKIKTFIVILLICLLMPVVNIVASHTSNESMKGQVYTDETGATFELYDDNLNTSTIAISAFSMVSALFASIVIAMLVAGEFGYGTIKNTASKGFSRNAIWISKLLTSCAVQLLFMIAYAVGIMVTAGIIWGFGSTDTAFWIEFMKTAGLHSLLNLAFAAIFTTVSFIVRQSGGAIALNICVMQFSLVGFQLLQLLLDKLFDVQINLMQYWVGGVMQEVNVSSLTNELAIRSSLIGICYFIGAIALGMVMFNKRDIK